MWMFCFTGEIQVLCFPCYLQGSQDADSGVVLQQRQESIQKVWKRQGTEDSVQEARGGPRGSVRTLRYLLSLFYSFFKLFHVFLPLLILWSLEIIIFFTCLLWASGRLLFACYVYYGRMETFISWRCQYAADRRRNPAVSTFGYQSLMHHRAQHNQTVIIWHVIRWSSLTTQAYRGEWRVRLFDKSMLNCIAFLAITLADVPLCTRLTDIHLPVQIAPFMFFVCLGAACPPTCSRFPSPTDSDPPNVVVIWPLSTHGRLVFLLYDISVP